MGRTTATTATAGASLPATWTRCSRWRSATTARTTWHGQLVDTRATKPRQTTPEPKGWQLSEQSTRRSPNRRVATTERGSRVDSTGETQGEVMGEVKQSGAKCSLGHRQPVFEDGRI